MSVLTAAIPLLPASWDSPVLLDMGYPQAAIVTPTGVAALDDQWDVPGVYVLLWPTMNDGVPVYVGKATKSLRKRIRDHVKGKDGWVRAILLRRLTPFTSAHSGWLEGHMVERLRAAPLLHTKNRATPTPEHLPAHEEAALHQFVEPLLALLRLAGANPDLVIAPSPETGPIKSTPTVPPRQRGHRAPFLASQSPRRDGPASLAGYVEDGRVTVGTVLAARYKGHEYRATVTAEGGLLVDGDPDPFPSLSTAANSIAGHKRNGWVFWRLPSGAFIDTLRH